MNNKTPGSSAGERRGSNGSVNAREHLARAAKNSGGDSVQVRVECQSLDGRSSPEAQQAPAQVGGEAQCNGGRLDAPGLAKNLEGGAVHSVTESQEKGGRAPSDTDERGAVQKTFESHIIDGRSALTADIKALQEGQIRRKFCIGLVNKQTNAAKALVRRYCGFNSNVEQAEADREKINKRAAKIVESILHRKDLPEEESAIAEKVVVDLDVVAEALGPLLTRRAVIEKEMRRVAKTLPVYSWAKEVRGLGDLGLAVIVAEAGDLTFRGYDENGKPIGYPHVRMLWKRLGLAPYDGKAFSQWRTKGGLSAEEWTEAGYAPRRRAEIHSCVGEPLLKAQGKDGPYRLIYDERRATTAVAHPDWSKAHSHGDAMRIMTKVLIADLWSAWRGSMRIVEASGCLARASSVPPDVLQDAAPVTAPRKRRRGSTESLKATSWLARADSIPGAQT